MTEALLAYAPAHPAPRSVRMAAMRRVAIWAAAALLAVLALAASYRLTQDGAEAAVGTRIAAAEAQALVSLTEGSQAEVLSDGESAQARNALIPVSKLALEKPGGISGIARGTPAYDTALQCLSQAIYYEAANEAVAGKRAVAQVVLNRMRHPAYPASVCGVVYEGSDRRVCQFSFTCDGSLLRKPAGPRWAESRQVAEAALNGATEPSVGTATHYHADYVLPRWAYTLAKIEKIGAHIFYRFPGGWGRREAFSARWSGSEHIPALNHARLQAELDRRMGLRDDAAFPAGLTVAPHVTDRHAANDVGGRLDTTKQWRLSIPDPVAASSSYNSAIAGQLGADGEEDRQGAR